MLDLRSVHQRVSMETWRSIDGYPDYEVSDRGRVRSVKKEPHRILKPQRHTGGYRIVTFWHGGVPTIHLVHKLVLTVFVGPRPDGTQACHGNGDRTDNRVENLRWDTPSANQADRIRHGTRYGRPGTRHRLTRRRAEEIRQRYAGNVSALARELNLPRTTVADIINRRTYAA